MVKANIPGITASASIYTVKVYCNVATTQLAAALRASNGALDLRTELLQTNRNERWGVSYMQCRD